MCRLLYRGFFLYFSGLSVPFITQIIDLAGQFGEIFVRSAFVMPDHGKQTLTGCHQPLVYTRTLRLRFGLLFADHHTFRTTDKCGFFQIINGSAVWCHRRIVKLIFESSRQYLTGGVFSMTHKYLFRFFRTKAPAHSISPSLSA